MTDRAPLLQTRDLILRGKAPLEVGSLVVDGPSLALWNGAAALLPALTDPELIAEGSLLLGGEPPADLLSQGAAAYVPQKLPLPDKTKVKDALLLSARLLGLGRSDVEESLSRVRLTGHRDRQLGALTRLQSRLLSLAHGLCGNPKILLLENLYADLDEPDAAVLESLLETELSERTFIAATTSGDPESRALALDAEQVLMSAGNQVLPPTGPEGLVSDGHWVTCSSDAAPLAARLTEIGIHVTKSPRPSVLLVRKASGSAVYRSAAETGLTVLEFTSVASSAD